MECKIAINQMKCIPCGVCVLICPRGALMTAEQRIEVYDCNGCGLCVRYCPLEAMEVKK